MIAQEPLFQVHARLAGIMNLGQTPYGERRIISILGGSVEGGRLKGVILPGGADWQIIRADGVADIQARYTIEAEGGSRILVNSEGLRHGPPEVMARLARGEPADADSYYFRTAMRFETSAPELNWLNRILAVARGAREPNAVRLDVFEVI